MPPDSNNDAEPSQQPSYMEQMINLANGLSRVFHKTGDATAGIALEATNKLKENAAVSHVFQLTSKASTATIDAGKQVYRNVNESPVTEKMVQWTESKIGSAVGTTSKVASEAIDVGKQAYQSIADSPITGPAVRFTGATLGSGLMLNLWAKALTSRVGKQALRATCIRNAIQMYNWLHLPASLRAAAIASGVHANNYILSGIVPGLFTVWAIYDGYQLVRLTYGLVQENEMLSKL